MCSSLCSGLTCGGLICRTTSQAKPPTTNSTNKYPNVKQLSWARVPHHHYHSIIIRKVLMINGIPGDQLSRTFGWFGYLLISTWKKTIIQLIRSSTWSIYWFQLEWSNTNVTDFSLVVVAIVIVLQVVSKFYLHLHRAPRAALCSWAALRYHYLYKKQWPPPTIPPSSSWSPSLRPLFTICAELSPVPVELSRGELLDNSRALYHFIQTNILHLRYCILSFLYKPVLYTWTRQISVSFIQTCIFTWHFYTPISVSFYTICILYLKYYNFCIIL